MSPSSAPQPHHAEAPRLEVQNLVRRFDGQVVVDDVSFSIPAGQVTCLLGPSGCGKSTTLRIIAGVDMQDQGKIFVDGNLVCDTVFRVPPERRAIGLMFQDFALFPHLSVADNVAFGLDGSRAEKRARVVELLERVHLEKHIDSYPHALSGGEQQRVALARALAPRPRILLMDEPFLGAGRAAARRHPRRDAGAAERGRHRRSAGHARAARGDAHGRPDPADARRQDRAAWRAL